MQVVHAEQQDRMRWEGFVADRPEATNFHRWGWRRVIERAFGWPTHYLLAEDAGRVVGVLPLAWQKSFLFGRFLTSLPFFNAGGILAESPPAAEALVSEAAALARQLDAKYVELRHRGASPVSLPAKTNKVTVVRRVEADEEKMWRDLPHKVRTDVRKAIKADLAAELGGEAKLDEFYRVFTVNMRDLGTPVYARRFFEEMLHAFPDDTHVCLVRHQGRAIAGSFLLGFRGVLEAGWSSSLYSFLAMKPNVFLYWRIQCFAGQRGYHTFDFGRSTIGSGTHRFKMQWGSEEIPLVWNYWLPNGIALPELNPENPKYKLAIRIWQKLPLGVTKFIGPRIVRCLP